MVRFLKLMGLLVLVAGYSNCMNRGFQLSEQIQLSSLSTQNIDTSGSPKGRFNVVDILVGGSSCIGKKNMPCVRVKICSPGTSQCQEISNILLDTGSTGLRLFSSVVQVPLSDISLGSGKNLVECVTYADDSSDWGPIRKADVILGDLKAPAIPIQIIDKDYSKIPAACSSATITPDSSPADTGFNGILGLGLTQVDCGLVCETSSTVPRYYGCDSASCATVSLATSSQVVNPVFRFPSDNNGVILKLPGVGTSGAASLKGQLIIGIGTQANNSPGSSVKMFAADDTLSFRTTYNGSIYSDSFIDSGSNILAFPSASSISRCLSGGNETSWLCPAQVTNVQATVQGATGTGASVVVTFLVSSATDSFLLNNGVYAYDDIGYFSSTFDWGFPFFIGRNVYIGIESKTSSLGTGPYWAF